MKENFKYFVKLSSIGAASLIKINLLGIFSTVIVAIIGAVFLVKNIDPGHSAHVSPIPFLALLFAARPVGSILWLISTFGSPWLFIFFGNKYTIKKVANKLITDKSESLIHPLLDKVLQKFHKNQPQIVRSAGDYSMTKMRIIHEIKNDQSENKWLRKILVFAMKKVNMDDIDFNQENLNFYEIIKLKTIQTLESITKPSRNTIWILLTIQWAIVLFIALTNL